MKLLILIRAEIIDILILLVIAGYGLYSGKYKSKKSGYIFFTLAALLHSIFALITEITVNSLDTVPTLVNNILHYSFFGTGLLVCFIYGLYVFSLISTNKKKRRLVIIVQGIIGIACIVLMPCFDLKFMEGTATNYSWGIGLFITYGAAYLTLLTWDIIFVKYFKKIKRSAIVSVFPISLVLMIFWTIQIFVPEILFTASSITLVALSLFLSLENPLKSLFSRVYVDEMTRVYNRSAYQEFYSQKCEQISTSEELIRLACVQCDINGLKAVNDDFGHTTGDELVFLAAECLEKGMLHSSMIFRLGGDEFLVIYEDEGIGFIEEEIKAVKRSCLKKSERLPYPLDISMGYAILREKEDLISLINRADNMMYRDKEQYYLSEGQDRRLDLSMFGILRNSYLTILRVDTAANSFIPVQVCEDEKELIESSHTDYKRYLEFFINSGIIKTDDKADVEAFLSMDNLKAASSQKKRFTRRINGEYKTVIAELIYDKENNYVCNILIKEIMQ